MNRQEFLQTFASALAMGTVSGAPVLAAGDSWQAQFAAALARNPSLLGFQGIQGNLASQQLKAEGRVPENLRGVLYRNGPARHEIGDMRYRHWFDGDGMTHAFRFHDDGVTHIGRFVETSKYKAETEAGQSIFAGFGTRLPHMKNTPSADAVNTANINVIHHNGELLALWEGGSAYRLDPETLETLGLKSWSSRTAGLPFGAHPRTDRDGSLWNIGYEPIGGAIIIYHIGADGILHDTGVLPMAAVPMVHDFMITAQHLVLILPPYRFDKTQEGSILDRFQWKPELGGRALIIRKDDLTQIQEIEIPPFWVFHFANAYEDSSGTIRFQAPVYNSPSIMTSAFRDIMRGRITASDASDYILARLNPFTGQFDYEKVVEAHQSEFPSIDRRTQGQNHRFTILVQGTSNVGIAGRTVLRLDHRTETTSRYQYASHEQAEEHIFVPDPTQSGTEKGWILGTSLDFKARQSALNIFEADNLESGPVARLLMDYSVPLGLHGSFLPA